MLPSTSPRETLRFSGNKIYCSPRSQSSTMMTNNNNIVLDMIIIINNNGDDDDDDDDCTFTFPNKYAKELLVDKIPLVCTLT